MNCPWPPNFVFFIVFLDDLTLLCFGCGEASGDTNWVSMCKHSHASLTFPRVSQARLKPSPRLKCKSELFQLKGNCTD